VAVAALEPGAVVRGEFRIVEVIGRSAQENRYRAERTRNGAGPERVQLRERLGPTPAESHREEQASASGEGASMHEDPAGPHGEQHPVRLLGRLNAAGANSRLGAGDYIQKPFSLDELLARIRVRLRGAVIFGDEHVLRGGKVVLDVARRQAGVGERSADLSAREFRLLHHLLVHAGEVVSRERLLAEVWGYDFDPGSNVVEVCVRRLRQKLGPEAAIETVRNAGYRLAAA